MNFPVRSAVVASPDYPFSPIAAEIKLDQNESAEDFPAALKSLVLQQLADTEWHRYPDLNSETLMAHIASYEGWSPAGTVVTTGSNVLISLLIQLTALGGSVVTVKPNFALYGLDAALLGSALTELALRPDFSLDVDAIISALDSRSDPNGGPAGVIYVPRPHAPTGSISDLQDLERLAQASDGWLLVIDEAYHQFAESDAKDLARRYPHIVLLRTFSKAWGLAGIRLGYALASDGVARQLRKLVPPFAVSVMQAVTARVALAHPEYMRDSVATTIRERERMLAAMRLHPTWTVMPSKANFLLIRTPSASKAFDDLLAHGVLVRRQDSHFMLDGCIRVTVGSREANDAFLKAAGVA
jgi:histidinol-phosphate aminotransferase